MERFADHCQAACDAVADPWDRLQLLGFAHLEFALSEPSAYQLLFEKTDEGEYPELDAGAGGLDRSMWMPARQLWRPG